MKGFVYLIGAGPGDPDLITIKGKEALERADCVIYDYLANPLLIEELDCEKIYAGKRSHFQQPSQEKINELIVSRAREGKTVARLKGGDPFIFGRGGEEAEELVKAGIPFAVIPGVSSFFSVPAYAGISLTHRDHATSFEVVTGHRRADKQANDLNYPEYNPSKTFVFLMGVTNLSHIAESLVKLKNFPENTPTAVISWGTTPGQKVATGPLNMIAQIVEQNRLTAPSTIIVGEVVKLREKLRWFDNQPLFGKKIAVTRTREQASKLSKKLREMGADIIEFPTIEIKPFEDESLLEDAIKRLRDYDWLFLTSQNAVNIFFDKIFKMGLDCRALGNLEIAVIGAATGDELIKYGLKPDVVPKEFVAESLLEEMKDRGLKGKKVLLPCAEEARMVLTDGLKDMGADVTRIHIYETVIPSSISDEKIDKIKKADVITFTSSSTARNFFSLIPQVNAELASIGPVTSKTITNLGFKPSVIAKTFTIDGLIEAIVEHFRK